MALSTVQNYIDSARLLLQDTVEPYRYSDATLLLHLNSGQYEARRLRPDIFAFADDTPQYTSVGQTVTFPDMYKMSLVYYMAGLTQVIDNEDVSDGRAASFLDRFRATLISTAA